MIAERGTIPGDYLYDQILGAVATVCRYDPEIDSIRCETDSEHRDLLQRTRGQLILDGATVQQIDGAKEEAYRSLLAMYRELNALPEVQ